MQGEVQPTAVLYPNPFSNEAMIEFPNPDRVAYELWIKDVTGKTVSQRKGLTGHSVIIEKGDLNSGLYFYELVGPVTFRGKFIIQ